MITSKKYWAFVVNTSPSIQRFVRELIVPAEGRELTCMVVSNNSTELTGDAFLD